MVNDSKQSSISGGQGALLRSGLTLLLPPKEEEVSFWVGGGNPHKTVAVNPHYHRIQEGFCHADCHPLHTLPGHIHLGHSMWPWGFSSLLMEQNCLHYADVRDSCHTLGGAINHQTPRSTSKLIFGAFHRRLKALPQGTHLSMPRAYIIPLLFLFCVFFTHNGSMLQCVFVLNGLFLFPAMVLV